MSETRSPDLSVVVVSYNTRALLEECLRSVLSGSSVDPGTPKGGGDAFSIEVFVVDNASRDGSAEMVRTRFPSACLIENGENRGFAAANNQAFTRARGRHILMLNSDAAVRPGALEALVGFMDAHPKAGACGGKLLYGDGRLQHSAFHFPSLAQVFLDFFPVHWRLMESRLNGRYPIKWYARGEPFPVDHLLGADLLVRREAAERVGWLDEHFFIYCEEIDWCMRIRRAGWEICCVPQAEIVHREAQSTRQFRDAMFVELWRARLYLFEKHYSRSFRWAARHIVRAGLASAGRQARAAGQAGRITQEEMEKRLAACSQVQGLLSRPVMPGYAR